MSYPSYLFLEKVVKGVTAHSVLYDGNGVIVPTWTPCTSYTIYRRHNTCSTVQYRMYYTDIGTVPRGTYDVIYADAPWSYNDKMTDHSFSLDHEYATQSLTWIKGLPVKELAAKDAVLFHWVVSPQLPEGIDVMRAWGFKFKTVAFVWSKRTVTGKEVANLGRWTMGNVEMCLLGVKGRPKRITRNVRQLVTAVRTRHSRKPDCVRERITTLMGDHTARLELFARGDASDGWDRWGDSPNWTPSL